MLRQANLFSCAVGHSIFVTWYLGSRVKGRAPIVLERVKAVHVRCACGLCLHPVLSVVVRARAFDASLPLVVTQASASSISVSTMALALEVLREISVCLTY